MLPDPPPAEFATLLEQRRQRGADRHDEVWDGVYRMMPAPGETHWLIEEQAAVLLRPLAEASGLTSSGEFNLGSNDDYRVPDRGLHRPEVRGDWRPTAALVVEIVSPGDETRDKLPFYAARQVDEVVIIDPREQSIVWLGLTEAEYGPLGKSGLIDLGPSELASSVDWPG